MRSTINSILKFKKVFKMYDLTTKDGQDRQGHPKSLPAGHRVELRETSEQQQIPFLCQ